jgi:preprotein translocase subunit SecD
MSAGAKRFAEVTRQNIHKRLAIVIDGKLCQAPTIQTVIPSGKAQLSGAFTSEDAADFVKKINNALPKG